MNTMLVCTSGSLDYSAVIFGHIRGCRGIQTGIGKFFAVTGLILGYMTFLLASQDFVVLSILQSLGN